MNTSEKNFKPMCMLLKQKSHFWGGVNNLPFLLRAHTFVNVSATAWFTTAIVTFVLQVATAPASYDK